MTGQERDAEMALFVVAALLSLASFVAPVLSAPAFVLSLLLTGRVIRREWIAR